MHKVIVFITSAVVDLNLIPKTKNVLEILKYSSFVQNQDSRVGSY